VAPGVPRPWFTWDSTRPVRSEGKPRAFGIVILNLSPVHGTGEVDFVTKRNAEITDTGNFWLALAGAVHRSRADGGQPEAAPLVEAERPDVVVGRGQRDVLAAEAPGLGADRLDQQGADALVLVQGVDR